MAILRGFPPSNTISPSVRIAEKDLSFITAEQSAHRAGLIGFASKGPINLPIAISTSRQLHTVFGNPHPDSGDPFLIYAADQYLLVANELYVVRVADTDPVSDEQALTASVDVPAAGTVVEIESTKIGPHAFDEDSFFRWKLNGELSTKTLVVPENAIGWTSEEVVDTLNSQIDFENDGIEFYLTDITDDNSPLGVRTIWAYGPLAALEFVSIQDAIYGGDEVDADLIRDNPTGLGTGMTRASVTASNDMFPLGGYVAGVYDLSGLSGEELQIQIVVDGTDNILIDQVVQTIELDATSYATINDVVTAINDQKVENAGTLPGGWEALASGDQLKLVTKHHGADARLRIKPNGSPAFVFVTTTKVGTTPEGQTGNISGTSTYGLVTGGDPDGSVSFVINADSPGVDGNETQVVIVNSLTQESFNIEIYSNSVQVEAWGNVTKNQASSYYIETYMSLVSDYIRVIDDTDEGAGPTAGTYNLVGGTDGIPADPDKQDVLLMGNALGYTGIYTLSEPEQVNIDLIAVPGHSSTAVVQEVLAFCRDYRQDCLAIIDAPFGLAVKEVVAWQNGTHPLNNTRFDSDFGALYWPWVKIYDSYNKVDVWCPPSGSVMAVIARSDFLGAPWFAPAGLTRGLVPNITDVYNRPTLEERDTMYGNRNCVNPIVKFADTDGFVVFGQKTLQRLPTALDRVNVRRLMFYIEKAIRTSSRGLLFDPNDSVFRQKFINLATNILNNVKVGRGVTDFRIQADEELNTPDVIDRNEFRARIGVQPTRAAEFIFIEFSIHRTGSFAAGTEAF